jgi:hypothetical protein
MYVASTYSTPKSPAGLRCTVTKQDPRTKGGREARQTRFVLRREWAGSTNVLYPLNALPEFGSNVGVAHEPTLSPGSTSSSAKECTTVVDVLGSVLIQTQNAMRVARTTVTTSSFDTCTHQMHVLLVPDAGSDVVANRRTLVPVCKHVLPAPSRGGSSRYHGLRRTTCDVQRANEVLSIPLLSRTVQLTARKPVAIGLGR